MQNSNISNKKKVVNKNIDITNNNHNSDNKNNNWEQQLTNSW